MSAQLARPRYCQGAEHMLCASNKPRDAEFILKALRGIEWINLVFPDVNMLVHVNVNVPEKV